VHRSKQQVLRFAQDDNAFFCTSHFFTSYFLLCNHAAGDAVAGIARGVGLLVVGLGVHHDCRASVAEQRMAVAAERNVFILPPEMCFAIGGYGKVWTIPSMVAFRIFQTMLLVVGIEMASCGLEVRGFALCVLMKVDGMFAGRQILESDFHPDSRGGFPQSRGAYDLPLGILELYQSLGRTGRRKRQDEQSEREQTNGFHGGIIANSGAPAPGVRKIDPGFVESAFALLRSGAEREAMGQ